MIDTKLKGFVAHLSLFAFILFAGFVSSGQSAETSSLTKHELDSRLMARKMPYEVLTPTSYGSGDRTYPVLYLLHGLTGKYSNWAQRSKLKSHARAYEFIIVMPEGNNGWYTDSPVVKNDRYEGYIVEELIPEIEKKFRVNKNREGRAIAGLSMGGYGALKFGLRFPDKFVVAGSFSGALRAVEWDENTFPVFKVLGTSVNSAFGKVGSPTREQHNIYSIVKGLDKKQITALPFLYLDCGTEDGLVMQNKDFVDILMSKKIPHEYRQLPGKHDWNYWDRQIQEFLDLAGKFLK